MLDSIESGRRGNTLNAESIVVLELGSPHFTFPFRSSTVHRFLVRNSIETALHGISAPALASPRKEGGGGEDESGTSTLGGPPGARRTSSGEDKARLLQMTISQLLQLLEVKSLPSAACD